MTDCRVCGYPLEPKVSQYGPPREVHDSCRRVIGYLAAARRALAEIEQMTPHHWRRLRSTFLALANSRPVPGQERGEGGRFLPRQAPPSARK